jgi:phosphoethanolamine N-methyltransferase
MSIEKIISEYDSDYCNFLELCYGEGSMSEGGDVAIEDLFSGCDFNNKNVLEIGFGLAGMASYLATKFPKVNYTGIEINPDLVTQARQKYTQNNIKFLLSEDGLNIPVEDDYFDYIVSDGVLVHLDTDSKKILMKNLYQKIKTGGGLIIADWLSPDGKGFGPRVDKMCKLENLSLFATSVEQYQDLISKAGFQKINILDKNDAYVKYNLDVIERLGNDSLKAEIIDKFGQKAYQEAIESYTWIAEAFKYRELLATKIEAWK